MTILQINDLCSSYEGRPLLKNITFNLEDGEILCLLGPSGSGKTTLLRMLAGLEQPDSGSMLFNGSHILNIPPHRRHFGMMFQEYALFPHKNVFDNIIFGLETGKHDRTWNRKRVEEMLEIVGLRGYGQRRINELSGGEQQRVALARSLAPSPRLLLLDEPLGSLDRTLRDRLAGEIRAILKKVGLTAIFVTHDQAEAFSVADQVAILFDGRLEQFDRPEAIYTSPANSTVAGFLGFKNIFSTAELADLEESGLEKHLQSSGATAVNSLLIRPEGARLHLSTITEKKPQVILTGTVKNRTFQGATYSVRILSGSNLLHFDLPLEPTPPEPGRKIELEIKPSAIVPLDSLT
ncbi:ABC transporter ATP-binding protein [Desulfomarina profundi]|uniref:ABC transporter ATP-binding protein n=1 Tax=Desulfomarina profundi TaxID=2772557 RepID=A0A8D5FP67_9BACT|nr:ABC transporter ATP-binding protein [Desulfomarina profundi]BCL61844.1 ABC transporter ATP-binding protein [Desulfomarina profundi]